MYVDMYVYVYVYVSVHVYVYVYMYRAVSSARGLANAVRAARRFLPHQVTAHRATL